MHTSPRFWLAPCALGATLMAITATALAATPVTRTLQQTVNVPTGDHFAIENLAGHMQVVQGSGPVRVDATVVAGGDHAAALAQSVKLDVSTSGKRVLVHVHYPVQQHHTFLYSPTNAQAKKQGEICILGKFICFHGHSTDNLTYQDQRVTVHQSTTGGSGTPLYVDVVLHVPAQSSIVASNAVGLLQADNLADNLDLSTQGGDIRLDGIHGRINTNSNGGDLTAGGIEGAAHIRTNGGDIHLQDFQGRLDARSNGGNLTASHLTGTLRVASNGGDMRLDTVSGDLSASTSGGDVHIEGNLSALKSLRAHTSGGNLRIAGDFPALTSLRAGTSGGDILLLAGDLSAHLTASTSGGSIDVHLPGMRNVARSQGSFSADVGTATGSASLSSAGGDITIKALDAAGR